MNTPAPDDLSRLRAIAEEGREAPLLGGTHLVMWGCLVALAAALHWGVASRLLEWPAWSLAVIWFGLMGLGGVLSSVLGRGIDCAPAAPTIGNRVERTVWITTGAVFATIAIALFVYGNIEQTEAAFAYYAMMPPITFGAYAVALNTSAVAGAARRLVPFAVLSLALAAVTVLMIGDPAQYLVVAAGALLVSVVPGFLQLRAEKAGD
ncbi:MAG: hypothetical protein HKN78_07050 [Sphingomonadaceae bacterium]|nr:hypothetical protein [Sphingomonadaceae bacterium]